MNLTWVERLKDVKFHCYDCMTSDKLISCYVMFYTLFFCTSEKRMCYSMFFVLYFHASEVLNMRRTGHPLLYLCNA